MNAIQPSRPPVQSTATRPLTSKKQFRRRHHPHRMMALETTAKLTANMLISAIAVSGLLHLIPYQQSQQQKLQEIGQEVDRAEGRVDKLQTDFTRYFDPQQASSVMQEQSNLVNPGQRQVILLNPAQESAPE